NSEQREKVKAYVVNLSLVGENQRMSLRDAMIPSGSIAVIPILGEIFKEDTMCGLRGSKDVLEDLKLAESNSNIKSVLLVVDSPGGQVSFTDILAKAITNCSKPVIAYVEGMAASAAYWIISGSTRIIASSNLDRIGSIGTMLAFTDLQPYYESLGVKFHEFYATKSTDKNKDINDVLDGKYDDYRKNTLDVINEQFLSDIKANRPGLDESTLTGKIYFAPDAIAMGLIDEIGTMDYALECADGDQQGTDSKTDLQTISDKEPIEVPADKEKCDKNKSNSIDMKMTIKASMQAIMGYFGWKAEEVGQEKELTSEMIDQLNDKLTELESKNIELEGEQASRIQKEEELTTLQTKFDQLQADYNTLKNQDAGKESGAVKKEDSIQSEPTEADNFSHNKVADKVSSIKK
ncbi:MAG: S49 family peptidase, partial [Candidatus Staskawiczbacteria bacterium]